MRYELRGRVLEMGRIFRRPPVGEASRGVELAALVVEAVADLVADGGADGAVARRGARLRIVEGRLENRGGEVQGVLNRQVDGVDRLRFQPPFTAVGCALQFLEAELIVEQPGAERVADRVAA